MIYPDISAEDWINWIKKHPALTIRKIRCNKCKESCLTDKPFINQKWYGLIAICKCNRQLGSSLTARTDNIHNLMNSLFISIE